MLLSYLLPFIVALTPISNPKEKAKDKTRDKKGPDFVLHNIYREKIKFSELKGKFFVLEWINPDCDYSCSLYHNNILPEIQKYYKQKDITWVCLATGGKESHGNYSREEWRFLQKSLDISAKQILIDRSGKVAHAYKVKTTPHFIVLDKEKKILYSGFGDKNPETLEYEEHTTLKHLKKVLEELCNKGSCTKRESGSYGCTIG